MLGNQIVLFQHSPLLALTSLSSTVVPFLLLCCDCGGAPGGGAGFEPVPECSDGAIHTWAVEGPQPEPHDVSAYL